MKLSVRCSHNVDGSVCFEFSAAGAPYRGAATPSFTDGAVSGLSVRYSIPRNEVITPKMREEFDPFVIEAVLRELSSQAKA